MRDHKIDMALCESATKGMPFDIVGLADMARWYMTRCTGLEVQLKCAEDANDQLKAGAEAEIKRLTERVEGVMETTRAYQKESCRLLANLCHEMNATRALETENQKLREALAQAQSGLAWLECHPNDWEGQPARAMRLISAALKGE